MVANYLDPNINPKRRRKADKFIYSFLNQFSQSMPCPGFADDVLKAPNKWWFAFKKFLFIMLVFCGVIHSVSAAFDGVYAVLMSLQMSPMFVSIACVALGIFGVMIFFSYEMTKLARAFDLDETVQITSRAKEMFRMQEKLATIRSKLESHMRLSLQSSDLVSYKFYNRLYLDLLTVLQPMRDQIKSMQSVKDGWLRKIFKGFLALLAGFLAGSVAYFDGFSLIKVISSLFSITISGGFTFWLPIAIGMMCFAVIAVVGFVNEGANIIRVFDELRGHPFDVIHQNLNLTKWEVSNYEEILMKKAIVDRTELKPKVILSEETFTRRMVRSDDELTFEYEENYKSMTSMPGKSQDLPKMPVGR